MSEGQGLQEQIQVRIERRDGQGRPEAGQVEYGGEQFGWDVERQGDLAELVMPDEQKLYTLLRRDVGHLAADELLVSIYEACLGGFGGEETQWVHVHPEQKP
ncbi:MAG: hypothetical protein HYV08_16810 [Deltaproteobacteria bacterium]|nr:hypothetical protein [Deltaproteobacteria bacterium]MBI3077210.1 hypothetical protein [Deltaproteobacteria bacterium]